MKTLQHMRLGALVLVASMLLIAGLYFVGQQQNLFSSNATLYAHFHDIDGLMPGNNVRFNGYSLGRVVEISPYNDSLIQVVFTIDQDWLKFISVNAQASLGTDGLLGNKLLEIDPGFPFERSIGNGDTIAVRRQPDMDAAMRTLNATNNNLLSISSDLKNISGRLSNENSLLQLLSDTSLSDNVRGAVVNLEITSARTATITGDLQALVGDVRMGRGNLGAIITDTSLYSHIRQTIVNIESISDTLAVVSGDFKLLSQRATRAKGNVATFITDTTFVGNLNAAVNEIRVAAKSADETMNLLGQSRLLKRYKKRQLKLEKQP
jgi:phospholipid/cholesterol/gamma-HCH transport system substrate-binding protein